MISKLIEATNEFNWGRFLVAVFSDEEWSVESAIGEGARFLSTTGKSRDHFLMLDIVTGEGAFFLKRSNPAYDLNSKHQIWVCPMFEPTLTRIAGMEWTTPLDLPDVIHLTEEEARGHSALAGYRRQRAKGKNRQSR